MVIIFEEILAAKLSSFMADNKLTNVECLDLAIQGLNKKNFK